LEVRRLACFGSNDPFQGYDRIGQVLNTEIESFQLLARPPHHHHRILEAKHGDPQTTQKTR
jgi:hypothetical protein